MIKRISHNHHITSYQEITFHDDDDDHDDDDEYYDYDVSC